MNSILIHRAISFLIFTLVIIIPFRGSNAEERTLQACRKDEICNYHFQLWKKQIIKRGISDDYFNAHFSILNTDVRIRDGSTLFKIDYLFTIDWASIGASNDFTVSPANNVNTIDLVTPLMPINKLKYLNQDDALEDAQRAARFVKLEFDRLTYWVPGRIPRNDGYPYLLVRGTIDHERNKCVRGYLNLFTGEIHLEDTHCWIRD